MKSDVILNKIGVIERSLKRVKEVYANNPQNLEDFTKQDSIVFNIQRACQASIDLAMHIVALRKLGLPQTSRDAFDLLCSQKIISAEIAARLKAMVGFRNIAMHDYQTIKVEILQQIIEKHIDDFYDFTKQILKH